jgi:hypothetical protein
LGVLTVFPAFIIEARGVFNCAASAEPFTRFDFLQTDLAISDFRRLSQTKANQNALIQAICELISQRLLSGREYKLASSAPPLLLGWLLALINQSFKLRLWGGWYHPCILLARWFFTGDLIERGVF